MFWCKGIAKNIEYVEHAIKNCMDAGFRVTMLPLREISLATLEGYHHYATQKAYCQQYANMSPRTSPRYYHQ